MVCRTTVATAIGGGLLAMALLMVTSSPAVAGKAIGFQAAPDDTLDWMHEAPRDTLPSWPQPVVPSRLGEAAPDTVAAPVVTPAARPAVRDFFDTGVSGTAAVLMSPVFPGWGQLYTENSWRAMLAFGAQWYFWSNMLARDRQAVRYRDHARTLPEGNQRQLYDSIADEYWEQMRDFAWWSGAIVLIIALDAYVGAGLYGFDEEPLPVPSRFEEFFDRPIPEPIGSRGSPLVVIWQWGKRF